MVNIHATCVSYQGFGLLIRGVSGAGKSDIALRMIMELGAVLVADDRVDISSKENILMASCPKNIEGLLEVRGIGIVNQAYIPSAKIDLIIDLVKSYDDVERFPEEEFVELEGVKIKKVNLFAFEPSILSKIKLLVRI